MNIRPIHADDFESVKRIYNLSKLDELRFENTQFELRPLERDDRRCSELLECEIFVYEDGRILGYGALFGNEIRGLFVHPNARGKGIGSCLLEYLLARSEHPTRLFIAKTNSPARVLYERYGFEIIREFETTYNGLPVLANEMVRKSPPG